MRVLAYNEIAASRSAVSGLSALEEYYLPSSGTRCCGVEEQILGHAVASFTGRGRQGVWRQMEAIEALERQLRAASSNNSALQRQQQQLMTSVHTLIGLVSGGSTTHRPGDHVPF